MKVRVSMKRISNLTEMSRAKLGILAQIAAQIVVGVIGILNIKLLTVNLTAVQYGAYTTAFALVGVFSLVTNLGVNTVTFREISKSPQRASEIFGHSLGLRVALSLVVMPMTILTGFILYSHSDQPVRFATMLLSCYLLFYSIWSTCVAFFGARVRNDLTALLSVIHASLFFLGVIVATYLKLGLYGYIAAYIVSTVATAGIALVQVRRLLPLRMRWDNKIWRATMYSGFGLGIMDALNQLYHFADSILLSILGSVSMVGIYTVAYSLTNIFIFLPGYVLGNITPAIIRIRSEQTALTEIIGASQYTLTVIGILVPLSAFYFGREMVMIISDARFIHAADSFLLLSIGVLFTYIATPFIQTCIALEKQKGLLLVTFSTLLLNVILNIYLIPHYGIIGAASATALTELFSLIAMYYTFRRNIGLKLNYKPLIKPATAGLATLFVLAATKYVEMSRFLMVTISVKVCVMLVTYFGILLAIGGFPEQFRRIIAIPLSIIRRRLI